MNDTPPPNDTTRALRSIEVTLRKTLSHATRPRHWQVLIWGVCAVLAVVLSALIAAFILPNHTQTVVPILLLGGLGGVAIGVAIACGKIIWRGPNEFDIARVIQTQAPELRHDIISALRFGQSLEDGTFDASAASPGMASLHIQRVAKIIEERSEAGHLGALLPRADLKPALWTLAGVCITLAFPMVFAYEWSIKSLTGGVEQAVVQAALAVSEVEQRPVMGNLSLRMQPPDYTGLSEQMEIFTTGNATVIAGTYITFEGFVLPVRATNVQIVMETESEDGDPVRDVRDVEIYTRGRARGGFSANATVTYWFKATLDDGTEIEEPIKRTIKATPDEAPGVKILSHQGELEVSPDDVLELDFSAQDDMGLTELARISVFAGSEDEKRMVLDLPAIQSQPTEFVGHITLDLAEFNLQPRDRVILQIEALDTNTRTGPGVARSEPLVLYVSSPDDKHMKNIEAQQELVEALFMVLADYLEAPLGKRAVDIKGVWRQDISPDLTGTERTARFVQLGKVHQQAAQVYESMGELVKVLRQDPLMVERDLTLFSSLHEQLAKLHTKGARQLERGKTAAQNEQLTVGELTRLATWSMETEDALEKGILRLEDLLFVQQAKNVEATLEEIKELRERLKEMLERYKETGDPAVKEAIKREVERLRSRMQELSQRMQSQVKQLPAEHVNREAIEQKKMESEANKVAQDFNSIEDLLDEGDIDGALKALEQMGEDLDEMQKMVNDQVDKAEPEALSEFDQKMSELIDDANDLNELQQKLEQDTEALQQDIQKERNAEMKQQLEDLKDNLDKELDAQKKQLQEMSDPRLNPVVDEARRDALKAVKKIDDALKADDVDSALRAAEQASDSIEEMRFQAQMRKRFEKGRGQRQAVDQLMKSSQATKKRGERIRSELEDMMDEAGQQAEQIDPRAEKLAKRQQEISEQAEQMQQKLEDASGQYPGLKEQLEGPMKQSKQAMQDAQKGLGEQRMQRALDSERKAIETLRQLKQSMKDSVKKERQKKESEQDGQRGGSQDKVELPGKSDRRKPVYRELLQDGMKEDRLKEYESDIDRYYESLGK